MSSNNESSPATTSFSELLISLAAASSTGTIRATVPWQQTLEAILPNSEHYVKTWALPEIEGLVMQSRGSLVQHVHGVKIRIRKIPGINVSYRCIVAALTDFENPKSIGSVHDYICSYPTAKVEYTLSAGTADNIVELPVVFPIGIGNSVTSVLPPAKVPVILLYISGDSSLDGTKLVAELSGSVDIHGVGHVAGYVPKA